MQAKTSVPVGAEKSMPLCPSIPNFRYRSTPVQSTPNGWVSLNFLSGGVRYMVVYSMSAKWPRSALGWSLTLSKKESARVGLKKICQNMNRTVAVMMSFCIPSCLVDKRFGFQGTVRFSFDDRHLFLLSAIGALQPDGRHPDRKAGCRPFERRRRGDDFCRLDPEVPASDLANRRLRHRSGID